MNTITQYIAKDGTIFEDENKCIDYEKKLDKKNAEKEKLKKEKEDRLKEVDQAKKDWLECIKVTNTAKDKYLNLLDKYNEDYSERRVIYAPFHESVDLSDFRDSLLEMFGGIL